MIKIKIHQFGSGIKRFLYKNEIFVVTELEKIVLTKNFQLKAQNKGKPIALLLEEIQHDEGNNDHYFIVKSTTPLFI